ncbi:conserved protein of unknown function [Ectopseudomonas oleovorans]|uniref:Uncharacterized protein n=1 Tax=Ectopseudomonas oleovorans TaxID=301 RepID=A0A653B0V5_ECTOL|nr:conserved protein of unknown function [Pseudomonas oleovorans]
MPAIPRDSPVGRRQATAASAPGNFLRLASGLLAGLAGSLYLRYAGRLRGCVRVRLCLVRDHANCPRVFSGLGEMQFASYRQV